MNISFGPSERGSKQEDEENKDDSKSQKSLWTPRELEVFKKKLIGNTRCVTDFEKIAEIGEGTYGTVFKARDKESGEIVALKKIRLINEAEGFSITSLREITILQ